VRPRATLHPNNMLPLVFAFFGNAITKMVPIKAILAPIPFTVTSPYIALVYATCVVYLPFGLGLVLKIGATGGKVDNKNPRKQTEKLAATHPMFARLCAAEKNMFEGFPFFVAGLLGAVQAGVANDVVCMYATFWLLVRVLYVAFYAFGVHDVIGLLRTTSWIFSLATSTTLMYLAAEAASK